MSDANGRGPGPAGPTTDPPAPAPGAAVFDARLAAELRRPIDPGEIRFKLLREADGGAQIASYVDARLVIARLNLLCPGRWHASHRPVPLGMRVTMAGPDGTRVAARRPGPGKPLEPDSSVWVACELVICGQTFSDVGEGADPKAALSDSLKRAAVRAGIGESLYAFRIPTLYPQARNKEECRPESRRLAAWLGLPIEAATLRRTTTGRARLVIDSATRAGLVRLYERWLDERGRQGFGEPLAHGPHDEPEADGTALGDLEERAGEEAPADPPAPADPGGEPARTRITIGTDHDKAPPTPEPAGQAPAAPGETGDGANTDALAQIARAAARIPGRVDATVIATLGAILADRPRGQAPAPLPRTSQFTAALVEAIDLVVAAGWSAERLEEVLRRAAGSDLAPTERRQRLVEHLRAQARAATSQAA